MIISTKRFYFIMVGLTVLLSICVIVAAVVGNSLLKKQSAKLDDIRTQSQVIKEQEISLAKAKKDIETYKQLNEIARAVVPQDKDQAKTVREINAIANQAGIKLEQISFTSSNLGAQTTAPTQKTANGENAPSASKTPTAPLSQVKAVEGIKGVYSLEISIDGGQSTVSYYRFLRFLELLESNRRTAHVSQISLKPTQSISADGVTFSLKLNAYVKP